MGQANLGSRGDCRNRGPVASGFGGSGCRVRAVMVTFLAAGAAVLAVGIPAASATTWNLPAANLSAAGQDGDDPEIAIAPDGITTVVWRREVDGMIQAATRPVGSSTFGPVQDLSDAELLSSGPQVAVASNGETTVVWGQIGGGGFTIQAATRPAGSNTFGPVQNLATNQGTGVSASPQVAVAPDGETTVTWVDGSDSVKVVTRPAGSNTFGAVVTLSAAGDNASVPRVVVAPDGTTTVVWNLTFACSPGPTCYEVQARTRPAGSNTFGAVQDVSPTSEAALRPNMAVAADGATTVVWTLTLGCVPSPCEYTAQATTRPAGSNTFGAVENVSPTDPSNGLTNVAVAPDGATTVVWGQVIGSTLTIRARTRPAGSSTFGTIEDISEIGNQSTIQVAAAPDGAITVVWEWEDVALEGAHTVRAASRRSGASAFGEVTNLSEAGATPPSSRLAVAPNGAVTAVWAQFVEGSSRIQAASSDPTPPSGKPRLKLSVKTPTKVKAGKAFGITVKTSNVAENAPVRAARNGNPTTATQVKTCAKLPRGIFVVNRDGGKVKGRTICWTRSSLAVGKSVTYKATVRSSKTGSGSLRVSGTASASNNSGATVKASGSSKIRIVKPKAPKPKPPTG